MKPLALIPTLVLALPLIFFSGCAHSHPTASGSAGAPAASENTSHYRYPLTQIYLPAGSIDPDTVIPPPPAPGSREYKRDYAKLFYYQRTRTPEQCARAATEVNPDLENFYGPKFGPLTEEQVREWAPFLDGAVRTDSDYYIQRVKNHWKRPRPYIANPKIVPCIRKEGKNPAYPSGHAAFAELYAKILERLVPSEKATIEARARQIMSDRVLGGVHHPSDVRNGRKLGKALYKAFVKSPSFEKAFAALPESSHSEPNSVQ